MRVRRYSIRTIKSYLYWIKYFIVFNSKSHPRDMGRREIEGFLTHLAVERNVSSSTQSISLNAIAFLYNKFLDQPIGCVIQHVAWLVHPAALLPRLAVDLIHGCPKTHPN
jgi:hypothetical protein